MIVRTNLTQEALSEIAESLKMKLSRLQETGRGYRFTLKVERMITRELEILEKEVG